jgi:AcrR family transcriptional regulator
VLAAARRVFVAQGFHVATLDQIALEAGFSKGVVYSQFESKADMFLALLERRIEERKAAQLRVVDFEDLVEAITRVARAEPAWRLLVIEFRVFAARDRKLGRRYAALHESAIAGIVALLEKLYQRSNATPPAPLETLARHLLAIENGGALEDAVGQPMALRDVTALLRRVLGALLETR